MIKDAPPKHPDSDKWYYLQWHDSELDGSAIISSNWVVPAPLVNEQQMIIGLLVGVRLSGGVLADDYDVVNKITTSSSEAIQETMRIRIRESGH